MRNSANLIVARAIKRLIANPTSLLSGLGMSVFFLVVYDAAIGGIDFLPQFSGAGYMAYLLPMGVVSLLFASSAGSAQSLSKDIASGYFYRIASAPVPRFSFVLAAILADAVGIFLSALAILGLGILLGAPARGVFHRADEIPDGRATHEGKRRFADAPARPHSVEREPRERKLFDVLQPPKPIAVFRALWHREKSPLGVQAHRVLVDTGGAREVDCPVMSAWRRFHGSHYIAFSPKDSANHVTIVTFIPARLRYTHG